MDAVRAWYNGYLFGETVMYNPWSILSFIDRGELYWFSVDGESSSTVALASRGPFVPVGRAAPPTSW